MAIVLRAWPVLLLLGLLTALADAQQRKTISRNYAAGPLTAADYEATPPAESVHSAWTEFDYRFDYKYDLRTRGATRVATLSGVDLQIIVVRGKSWTRFPESARLMEHEQGHYDIMQAHALMAQIELTRNFRTADALQASGASRPEAVKKLRALVEEAVKARLESARAENVAYDKTTLQGLDIRAQAEARQAQRELITDLTAQWERVAAQVATQGGSGARQQRFTAAP